MVLLWETWRSSCSCLPPTSGPLSPLCSLSHKADPTGWPDCPPRSQEWPKPPVCAALACVIEAQGAMASALNPSGAEGETQVLGSERSPQMHWKEDSGLGLRSLPCGKKTGPTSLSLPSTSLPQKGTTSDGVVSSFESFLFFLNKINNLFTSSRIFSQLY